jgi:uracil-DNA glycosylase
LDWCLGLAAGIFARDEMATRSPKVKPAEEMLRVLLVALGRVAHESTLKALSLRSAAAPFAHGAIHQAGAAKLYDSYHCSRYNTNTRVLTPDMFRSVFAKVKADLAK